MTMVALDAARRKIVPTGSLEARWMVDEDEAEDCIREAKKHPKMQALMDKYAEWRLADEARSAGRAADEAAYNAARKEGTR